jgi:hypothetical protein
MKQKLLLMMIVIIGFSVSTTMAQNKALNKALKKEYKSKIKDLKKGGWELAGSSRSLDVALLLHYQKLNDLNNIELPGEVSSCKSLNICRQAALNNACVYYASLAGSKLKGRVVTDMGINQSSEDSSEEFDKMYIAYERLIEKEIKGEIQESFSIVRTNSNGQKEYRTYFLINEDSATKARIRAWENALRESEVAQKYASKISEWVKEGFLIE